MCKALPMDHLHPRTALWGVGPDVPTVQLRKRRPWKASDCPSSGKWHVLARSSLTPRTFAGRLCTWQSHSEEDRNTFSGKSVPRRGEGL